MSHCYLGKRDRFTALSTSGEAKDCLELEEQPKLQTLRTLQKYANRHSASNCLVCFTASGIEFFVRVPELSRTNEMQLWTMN